MRYRGTSYSARDATLGAFRPGTAVIEMLPANQDVPLDPSLVEKLRGRVGGPVTVADGRIYLGENPSQPRIGDLRVSHRIAPNGAASIVGRQAGSDFARYQTKAGDQLLMVRDGTHSATDMFAQAQRENRIMTWLLRLGGIIAMFFGFMLILGPLVVVADVVPFIGNVLQAGAGIVSAILTAIIAPVVIAIAWLWYRPLISIAVLVVGLGLAYGFKRLAARKAAARQQRQPAPA